MIACHCKKVQRRFWISARLQAVKKENYFPVYKRVYKYFRHITEDFRHVSRGMKELILSAVVMLLH